MLKSAVVAAVLAAGSAHAANVGFDYDPANWNAFMNVSELPSNGGGFVFGSPWGVSDLVASFDAGAQTITMSPNTIGDPDPFWYQGGGGPGAPGNKIMEANLYREVADGSLSGTTVTFSGFVVSNSFTPAHEARIFIRDFSSDFSQLNETIVDADAGAFSISLNTDAGAGRFVQWGFQVKGENVWFTDTAPFGNVVFSAVPSPGAVATLGLAGLVASRRRR